MDHAVTFWLFLSEIRFWLRYKHIVIYVGQHYYCCMLIPQSALLVATCLRPMLADNKVSLVPLLYWQDYGEGDVLTSRWSRSANPNPNPNHNPNPNP